MKPYTSFQYNTRCDADIGKNLYVNVLFFSFGDSVGKPLFWSLHRFGFRRGDQLDPAS